MKPPIHPSSVRSQSTNCYGLKTSLIAPFEWMQNLSDTTSEAEKAQQDPHLP